MNCEHLLDICSLAENTPSPDEQTRGCKISPGQQIPSLQRLPAAFSEVALSQGNNNDVEALLAYIFSKLDILPTSGYKGQRNRPGTGAGPGSNNTHSTEPYSRPVVDSTAHADGFGPLPPDQKRKIRKRSRDDDGPLPPNKLPRHDEEDSAQGLLCPFYVRDRHPFHECSKHRFKRTSDVRQHISRTHIQPPHCPTCGEIFAGDRSLERRDHIVARTCQPRPFSISGITAEQFDTISGIAIQGTRHRTSTVERWMRMFRVISPGAEDPVSPYALGGVLVQGMFDVRAAIQNGHSQASSSATSARSFGEQELSTIESFIGVARQLERDHDRASQAPSGESSSIHAAQVQSNQPPTNQAGGHGLAAGPFAQSHAPPLVQPSGSQDSDWTGIYQSDFGEGSSQSLENQELPFEYFFGQSGHYSWYPHRPT